MHVKRKWYSPVGSIESKKKKKKLVITLRYWLGERISVCVIPFTVNTRNHNPIQDGLKKSEDNLRITKTVCIVFIFFFWVYFSLSHHHHSSSSSSLWKNFLVFPIFPFRGGGQ